MAITSRSHAAPRWRRRLAGAGAIPTRNDLPAYFKVIGHHLWAALVSDGFADMLTAPVRGARRVPGNRRCRM